MGYSTDFTGMISITPSITQEHADYINKFTENRRQKWCMDIIEKREDSLRIEVGLPIGMEGEFFTGADNGQFGCCGQEHSAAVLDSNNPPASQPSLWCGWEIDKDASGLQWDGGEKFYNYIEWLQYMIDNFFKRWNYVLDGEIEWEGEERDDIGIIIVSNNVVETKHGTITYK